MPRHLSASTVSNPLDYNRQAISAMIKNMGEMVIAIDLAPGHFAVADINRLKVAADAFAKQIEELGRINRVTADWSHHKAI